MIITDLILGNNYILLFTWSGFALIAIIGYLFKTRQKLTLKSAPLFVGAGIGAVLMYDLWTNFGCWLGWYPHTLEGLTTCYAVSIPFTLRHLLTATIALTAVTFTLVYFTEHKELNYNVKPIRKPIGLAIPAILMIAAIVSLIV